MERHEIHDLTAAYALNALDEREAGDYEEHLARCEDCQRELASLRATAARLAYVPEAPAPSPALRERILDQARSERSNVVPLRPRWALPAAAAGALAACAAIALGIWAFSLSSRLDEERQAGAAQEQAVALLTAAGAEHFPVQGAEGTLAVTPDGRGALVLSRLEEAPGDKIYEAWVSATGEDMTPAGTFEASNGRTYVLLTQPIPDGGLVAVTLEDRPVETPTGAPIFQARTA